MRWYCFMPLMVAFCIQILEANQEDDMKKRDNQADLEKRIPYYIPRNLMASSRPLSASEEDNDLYDDRKRRTPYLYFNAPRQGFWKNYVSSREADPEDDNGLERKRVAFYYPNFHYGPFGLREKELDLEEDKRSVKKRGIPYFYPNYGYSFMSKPSFIDSTKRYSEWNRGVKRSMSDVFDLDSMSEFGFDKRRMAWDSGVEEEEEEEEDVDKKRKRKRTAALKRN